MDQSDEAAPTAPQARVVIRLDGPVPASALESVLEEHGVSAESGDVSDDGGPDDGGFLD